MSSMGSMFSKSKSTSEGAAPVKTGYQNYLDAALNYDKNLRMQEKLHNEISSIQQEMSTVKEQADRLDQEMADCAQREGNIRDQARRRTEADTYNSAVQQRNENQRSLEQKQSSLNSRLRQNQQQLRQQNQNLASLEEKLQNVGSGQYHYHVEVAGTDAVGVLNFQTFLKELYGKKQMPKQLLQYLKTPASAIAPSVAGFQQLQEQERRFAASKEAKMLYQSGVGKRDVLILTIQIYSLLAILTSLRSIGIGLFLLLSDPAGALDSFFLPVVYKLLFGNLFLGFLVTRDKVFGFLEGIVKHLGFMRKRAYCRILQYDINLDTAKLPIYCYVHHDELAACLEESQREADLVSLNASIRATQDQIKKLNTQQLSLKQEQEQLNREAQQLARDNQNLDAAGRREVPVRYTDQELRTLNDIQKRRKELESQKFSILQGQPGIREEFSLKKKKLERIKDDVQKNVTAFQDWNGEPPLDRENPVFRNFVVTERRDGAVILNHDRQSVEIFYETDSGNKPGIVVENVVRELVRAFSRMNPPELLNFHIIDQDGGGINFMRNGWFLERGIRMGSGMDETVDFAQEKEESRIHVYGKESELSDLEKYLTRLKKDITDETRQNQKKVLEMMKAQGLDSVDIDVLNRVRTSDSSGRDPHAYQILIFIVPWEDSLISASMPAGLYTLAGENVADSGILPVYLVNRNSVDKRWQEYLKKCRVHYRVDPVTGVFEQEGE